MAEIDKKWSVFTSETLDDIGYNQEAIKYRRHFNSRICQDLNKFSPTSLRLYLVGSTAEGVSLFYESDYDSIVVSNRVGCIDGSAPVTGIVYECDTKDTPPGYTRLKLAPSIQLADLFGVNEFLNSTFGNILYNTYYKSKMKTIVSSKYPVNLMCGLETTPNLKKVRKDFPLILHNTHILEELKNRSRSYDWPSKEVIKQIESGHVRSYVYPIGDEQSEYSHVEWRISHTDVESLLMDNLNETQIKVYILLKLIVKPALSIDSTVTSYTLKNVLFWMCLALHEDNFKRENLLSLLSYALGMLYNCVKCGHMSCFLIPERNLFPRLSVETKFTWLRKLTALREERGRMLLNNDKLRNFMMLKLINRHLTCKTLIEQVDRLLLQLVKLQVETKASEKADTSRNDENTDRKILVVKENIYKVIVPVLRARSSWQEIRKQADIYLSNVLS